MRSHNTVGRQPSSATFFTDTQVSSVWRRARAHAGGANFMIRDHQCTKAFGDAHKDAGQKGAASYGMAQNSCGCAWQQRSRRGDLPGVGFLKTRLRVSGQTVSARNATVRRIAVYLTFQYHFSISLVYLSCGFYGPTKTTRNLGVPTEPAAHTRCGRDGEILRLQRVVAQHTALLTA